MSRLIVCVGIVAGLLLAGSCGSPERHSPSVTVKSGALTLQLHSGVVSVFDFVPTRGPSGLITLKSVHDGHVRTLGSLRFEDMRKVGSVAVQVTSRKIDVAWNVDGVQTSLPDGPVAFPANTVDGSTAWLGITVGPADFADEADFWIEGRYVGRQPAQGSESVGNFDSVVRDSLDTPTKTSYCLTIKLDGEARPSI